MARTKQAVIIGGGFAGLSAACYMARAGYRVILLEKNQQVGGRSQFLEEAGFKFNLGPDWYIMPDIYEDFFKDFGFKTEDFYSLTKLKPGLRSFALEGQALDVSTPDSLAQQFGDIEISDVLGTKRLVNRSKVAYSKFKLKLLYKNWDSPFYRINFGLPMSSKDTYASRISKLLHSKSAVSLTGQLSLLIGTEASKLPANYSFLPYTIYEQGIWYPGGGFSSVVSAVQTLAQKLGVEIYEGYEAESIEAKLNSASAVVVKGLDQKLPADVIISATDYSFAENLLEPEYRSYKTEYWNTREYSPSSIILSLGLDTKLPGILHHNIFQLDSGPISIANLAKLNSFSVSCPSQTDPSLAPVDCDILNVTIPIDSPLSEDQDYTEHLIKQALSKISQVVKIRIEDHIVTKKVIASGYIKNTFNIPSGSTNGLSLTRKQTFGRRPRTKSKKLTNLYYAGQDTNPGPGAPFALVSGKIAAYRALGKDLFSDKTS